MARFSERLEKTSKPPNLRRGTAKARCGGCKHFSAPGERMGECHLYGWRVKSTEVCDSYKAKGGSR